LPADGIHRVGFDARQDDGVGPHALRSVLSRTADVGDEHLRPVTQRTQIGDDLLGFFWVLPDHHRYVVACRCESEGDPRPMLRPPPVTIATFGSPTKDHPLSLARD
jgi:hypothetical protein